MIVFQWGTDHTFLSHISKVSHMTQCSIYIWNFSMVVISCFQFARNTQQKVPKRNKDACKFNPSSTLQSKHKHVEWQKEMAVLGWSEGNCNKGTLELWCWSASTFLHRIKQTKNTLPERLDKIQEVHLGMVKYKQWTSYVLYWPGLW